MFVLFLNPMTGRAEVARPIARAKTREELVAFLASETVEQYRDGQWLKGYRKGGPLEWFNPPMFADRVDDWGHGIGYVGTADEAAEHARRRFERDMADIPDVATLSHVPAG